MRKKLIKKMAHLAILSTISIICYMFLKFPLPFIFPSFLDIQLSNLPVIIAGFVFGPIEAVVVVLIRFIIKLPFSSTAFIGEIADLIIGSLVAVTTSLIYKKYHNKKGGIIALICGSIVWVIGAVIANGVVLLPWYIEQFKLEAVLGILSVIPGINESNYMLYYLLFAVVPFNLLLATIVSLITFFIYKRISFLYKNELAEKKSLKTNFDGFVVGITLIGVDLLILIGTLMWNKKAFIVSAKNSQTDVLITILGYVLIGLFGIFLIVKNIIKNKKMNNENINS